MLSIDSLPDLLNKWGVPRATINYALAATLLSQGLHYDQAAPQCGAKDGNSLRMGLLRRGVTMTATRRGDFAVKRATLVAREVISAESARLKEGMSAILAKHTQALCEVPAKADLKHIERVGAALEPLARTAKIVHNWGESGPSGVVLVGEMDGTDRAPIDIPSTDVKLVSTSVEHPSPPREFDL